MIVQRNVLLEHHWGIFISNQDGYLSPKTHFLFHSFLILAETRGSLTLQWLCKPRNWHVNICPVCFSSSLPSHIDVSYEDFLVALQRYSTCEQRQGKWWGTQPAPLLQRTHGQREVDWMRRLPGMLSACLASCAPYPLFPSIVGENVQFSGLRQVAKQCFIHHLPLPYTWDFFVICIQSFQKDHYALKKLIMQCVCISWVFECFGLLW